MLKSLKVAAVALAAVGMIVPVESFAAEASAPNTIPNVKLTNGTLVGQIVDANGQPSTATVAVLHNGQKVAEAATDANGVYRFTGLRSGLHTVATTTSTASVRLWDGAAPPTAKDALVVVDGDVVRGQCNECGPAPCGGCMGYNPTNVALVVGAVAVASATAVAIAYSDDDCCIASP